MPVRKSDIFATCADGSKLQLYFRERLSAVTGIPPHTLTNWEKRKIMPFTPFRTPNGERLYALAHINGFADVIENELSIAGVGDIDLSELRKKLHNKFKTINKNLEKLCKGDSHYETAKEAKQRSASRGRNRRRND